MSIDTTLRAAIDAGHVPGLTAIAATQDGVFYEAAFGTRGVDDVRAMELDNIFRVFSMTKAIGTAAAVMLMERGEIELDQPVASILPAFSDLQVLEGFDGDTPIMRPPKTEATLRHLATHTSGMVYDIWDPLTAKYLPLVDNPGVLSGQKRALLYPMIFDPGTKWHYGIGIDWLGQVVEAVSGKGLDQFCREELFEPLGMVDTDFECQGAKRERLVTSHARTEDGTLVPFNLEPPSQPEFYGAGHGLYSTARDYMQFLQMMLGRGSHNGVQILKPETVDMMLQNHIGELLVGELTSVNPAVSNNAELFPGMPKKHSLGFVINVEQVPGMRAPHSQGWAGVLNTHYWFDPTNGVAGAIFMQLLPFADHQAMAIYADFEKAVYASL